jgi:hypothetical protein
MAVRLEAVERFADRSATALITLGEVLFDEALTERNVPEEKFVAEVLIDALGNRVRAAHAVRAPLLK